MLDGCENVLPAPCQNMPQLKAILFAEFDNEIGRVLRYQVPAEAISKPYFDFISSTLIPSEEWRDRLIRLNIFDVKVIGYPVGIRNEQYHRGMYIFNMCFIIDKADTRDDAMFEPVVQKFAEYLVNIEREENFLTEKKSLLPDIMQRVYDSLNTKGECVLSITQESTIYLKVCPSTRNISTEPINPYMVPVFTRHPPPTTPNELCKMDVLSQTVCPLINGIATIRDIASAVHIDVGLVARCMRNLHFCGCITFLPIFLYANQYIATANICALVRHEGVKKSCTEYIRLDHTREPPAATDVLRLYASLTPGLTFGNWCKQYQPRRYNIDERRFVQVGIYYNLVRLLRPYAYIKEAPELKKSGTPSSAMMTAATERGGVVELLRLHHAKFDKTGASAVTEEERPVDEMSIALSLSPLTIIRDIDASCNQHVIWR